ncbi:hypothetical protein ACOSP7_029751 [Xanthoceras sorbifolium]
MAESASAMNRRMVMIEGYNPSNEQQQQSKVAAAKENLDSNGEVDLNNHHNIPRSSFDGWDKNQHEPAADTLVSKHD